MNTKTSLGGLAMSMLLVVASGQANACTSCGGLKLNGPVLNGPIIQGPILQGPILQGPILQGPILQGPILQGPVLQGIQMQGVVLNGPIFQGPMLQGIQMNGPVLQGLRMNGAASAYGAGRGVFAIAEQRSMHVVPGHSAVSGIAAANVRVRLAR